MKRQKLRLLLFFFRADFARLPSRSRKNFRRRFPIRLRWSAKAFSVSHFCAWLSDFKSCSWIYMFRHGVSAHISACSHLLLYAGYGKIFSLIFATARFMRKGRKLYLDTFSRSCGLENRKRKAYLLMDLAWASCLFDDFCCFFPCTILVVSFLFRQG